MIFFTKTAGLSAFYNYALGVWVAARLLTNAELAAAFVHGAITCTWSTLLATDTPDAFAITVAHLGSCNTLEGIALWCLLSVLPGLTVVESFQVLAGFVVILRGLLLQLLDELRATVASNDHSIRLGAVLGFDSALGGCHHVAIALRRVGRFYDRFIAALGFVVLVIDARVIALLLCRFRGCDAHHRDGCDHKCCDCCT